MKGWKVYPSLGGIEVAMSVEIQDSRGKNEASPEELSSGKPSKEPQVKKSKKAKPWPTCDIEMAATLRTLGHKVIELGEKRDGKLRRVKFIFEHDKVKEDLRKWLNGELMVDPRELLNNFNDLKGLVNNKGFK
jgi:hypothetical protein